MNRTVFEQATDIVASRKNDAETTATKHIDELEKKSTAFAELNAQLVRTSCELSKLILGGGKDFDKRLDELRRVNLDGQKMMVQLLEKNGYPADYLEPKYTCQKCCDTGYIGGSRCTCLTSLIEKLTIDELNSHSSIRLYSFDSFDISYYSGSSKALMSKIFVYCRDYAESFSLDSDNIFMRGDTGLGKTHLSLSIAKDVIEKGHTVAYDSIINYLGMIEKEHFGRSDSDTLEKLLSVDLLILDDLGSEYQSAFYASTIYNIINTRLNRQLPTIISSNLTTDEFQNRYDDRIVSRLFGMYTYLEFAGEDVRQLKRIKKS